MRVGDEEPVRIQRHADRVADQGQVKGLAFAGPPDRDNDFAALGAAHEIDGLVQAHALDGHIVEFEDHIAGLHAGAGGR